ncbi:MAG TPA: hypothetical protein VK753_09050 [Xanthomonadaceae bacterium]|jgi:hypothetical protein|nr:hypothetical protein [Xanthomonadaceae bacterium]
MNEPTLEELLGYVLRDTGWIMAGGSAQFRQGALSELQSSLRLVRQHAGSERVLNAVKILSEKATQVAGNSTNDTDTIMGLRRILEEFEKAMKAYLATAKKR